MSDKTLGEDLGTDGLRLRHRIISISRVGDKSNMVLGIKLHFRWVQWGSTVFRILTH